MGHLGCNGWEGIVCGEELGVCQVMKAYRLWGRWHFGWFMEVDKVARRVRSE